MANLIKRFFSHYLPVEKGLPGNTILAYRDAVKLLLCYAADTVAIAVDELAVEDIGEKIVLGFLDELEQGRGCSTGTRKYGAQAQVKQPEVTAKPVNPHNIRHTSAMHLLRAGNDVNMVSYWLGHTDVNTTHIYVEIDMDMKQKMIAKAGAPDIGNKTPWQQPRVLQWLNRFAKEPQLCGLTY